MVQRRIEELFGRHARLVTRYRWIVSVSLIGFALALGSQIPRLEVEASPESYLHQSSPARVVYEEFRSRFGRDDRALLIVEAEEIFRLDTLERLRGLHRQLEAEVPHLAEVTSLVNVRDTRGEGGALVVGGLLDDWPESPADVARIEERARATPFHRDLLLSQRGPFTAIYVEPSLVRGDGANDALSGFDAPEPFAAPLEGGEARLATEDLREFVAAIERVAAAHEAPGFTLSLAGEPVSVGRISRAIERDSAIFTAVSVVAIALLLSLITRRVSGVVLPLVVVGFALLATQGTMVLMGVPLSTPMQMVPPLLLTVGVCGAVHLLSIFQQGLAQGLSRHHASARAMRHSGIGICMASFTTAAGLASFVLAEVKPVMDVGLIAPIGVLYTLVYVLFLLPALLAILPIREGLASEGPTLFLKRSLARAAAASCAQPGRVVVAFGVLVAVALAGFSQIRIGNFPLGWLPEHDRVREAVELFDRTLSGSHSLEIVVDSGAAGGVYEPALLRALEEATRRTESLRVGKLTVGRTVSLVDVLKETNQALHGNDPAYYAIPDSRALVAQELLLFEGAGSEDLEKLVDPSFRVARISVGLPAANAVEHMAFVERLERELRPIFHDRAEFALTGTTAINAHGLTALTTSLMRSYGFALPVITVLMIALVGGLRMGLLSMIPNLVPVVMVLGLMGWLELPLNASTLLVGSIILGVAVDDTIHFFHGYQRYFEESGDAQLAVQRTMETTGVALLTTSVVLSIGFLSFTLAYMQNAVVFGLLAAFATGVAFLADLFLAPALLVLVAYSRPFAPEAQLVTGAAR